MKAMGVILVIVIIGAAGYFAWWAIQRTLSENEGNRRSRRANRKH